MWAQTRGCVPVTGSMGAFLLPTTCSQCGEKKKIPFLVVRISSTKATFMVMGKMQRLLVTSWFPWKSRKKLKVICKRKYICKSSTNPNNPSWVLPGMSRTFESWESSNSVWCCCLFWRPCYCHGLPFNLMLHSDTLSTQMCFVQTIPLFCCLSVPSIQLYRTTCRSQLLLIVIISPTIGLTKHYGGGAFRFRKYLSTCILLYYHPIWSLLKLCCYGNHAKSSRQWVYYNFLDEEWKSGRQAKEAKNFSSSWFPPLYMIKSVWPLPIVSILYNWLYPETNQAESGKRVDVLWIMAFISLVIYRKPSRRFDLYLYFLQIIQPYTRIRKKERITISKENHPKQ